MDYSQEELQKMARHFADIYAAAEVEILGMLAGEINEKIQDTNWAQSKLRQIAQIQARIEKIVNPARHLSLQLLLESVSKVFVSGDGPAISTNARALVLLLDELNDKVRKGWLRLITTSVATYRTVIAQTFTLSVSGVLTRQQASRRILKQLAARGLTVFRDVAVS